MTCNRDHGVHQKFMVVLRMPVRRFAVLAEQSPLARRPLAHLLDHLFVPAPTSSYFLPVLLPTVFLSSRCLHSVLVQLRVAVMPSARAPREAFFKVVTHTSRQRAFAVPLPPDAKPLHATVETAGKTRPALLASFYNPVAHAWIVRHVPPPGASEAEVTVSVIVLLDRRNEYELQVSLATLIDTAVHNDERFALKQRSLLYVSALSGTDVESARQVAAERPRTQQVLTVVCPLEERADAGSARDFVACGGGFVSDYPVVASGPALPETPEDKFSRLLGISPVETGRDVDASLLLTADRAAPSPREPAVEWRGWQVSAAANAGLGCFTMSLRRRRASHRPCAHSEPSSTHRSRVVDATGLVPSLESSAVWSREGAALTTDAYRESHLTVRMTAVGGRLEVVLPPPHGTFTASLASQLPLYTAAQESFYSSS